jgi:cytochrome c553
VSYKNIRLEHYINDVAMNAYKNAMIDGEMPMFKTKAPINIMPIIVDNDNTSVAKGKTIYTSQCASCHGEKADANALGSGAVIANNTDEVAQLLKGYKYSSLNQYEKGAIMQGVASSLSDEDIESIALYIKSL